MKICIVSDSHDRADALAAAVETAQAQGAQAVIHCGDIIGANTLRGLQRFGLPVHAVHGNNLGDFMALTRLAAQPDSVLRYYGDHADIELAGKRIFVTHYPHIARGMACTGDYDLVCCGHSHEALIEPVDNVRGGRTLMVNPGTIAGIGGAPATYAIGDLRTGEFRLA